MNCRLKSTQADRFGEVLGGACTSSFAFIVGTTTAAESQHSQSRKSGLEHATNFKAVEIRNVYVKYDNIRKVGDRDRECAFAVVSLRDRMALHLQVGGQGARQADVVVDN